MQIDTLPPFEEHIDFVEGHLIVTLCDPQTGVLYYHADRLALSLGYASTDLMLSHDGFLDELNNFHRQFGRQAVRRVSVLNREEVISVVETLFSDQPKVIALRKSKTKPSAKIHPETKLRWEIIHDQDQWTDEEFTHLLSIVFLHYDDQERIASLQNMAEIAFDSRTPKRWAQRLQHACQWASKNNKEEVLLSHIARLELLHPNDHAPTPPFLDTNFS